MSDGGERRPAGPTALLAASVLAGVIGCANGAGDGRAILADGARTGLFGQRLGAPRARVLEALAARGAASRDCESGKLTPRHGRAAYPMWRCVHEPTRAAGPRLGEHRVERLVTRYVDDVLVRLDARLVAPEGVTASALRERLEAAFGAPDAASGAGPLRWSRGADRVELHEGTGERGVRLVLLDETVARALPALARTGRP